MFRLNRSVFKGQTAAQAADHAVYYRQMDWKERLAVSAYLNSVAYNYPLGSPPKMAKEKFAVKSRQDNNA